MKKAILTLGIAFAALTVAKAQTNIQVFYDFGKDRKHVTTTVEGFYNDNWGNTFFFVDHDFNNRIDGKLFSPNGTYMEIARCLNFWQNTKLGGLSAHIEYNGGIYNKYAINNAVLAGLDYFFHSKDYRNTLNLKVLYKWIDYRDNPGFKSIVPMQFTVVWGLRDLFGAKGLTFSGFADFWWQDHLLYTDASGNALECPGQSRGFPRGVHLRAAALVCRGSVVRRSQPECGRRGGTLL